MTKKYRSYTKKEDPQLHIRMPAEVKLDLERLAKINGRSKSSEALNIIISVLEMVNPKKEFDYFGQKQ